LRLQGRSGPSRALQRYQDGIEPRYPIAPYAARILREQGLERFAAREWRQTTAALVRASDLLVFMEREHYQFCEGWIDSIRQRIEIWDVPDIGPIDAAGIMKAVSRTFDVIRQRTDMLLACSPPVQPAL
jgi:protein-tyrosine-phosphatase